MKYRKNKIGSDSALTLVEMVIALAIMAIVFAVLVPQFRMILNSWDSKAGAAETLQNGRVLIDHLNRNLTKAVKITSVSKSNKVNGYIEFEDNDGNNLRYDIAANNYVEFGPVGDLSDLAGPVSQLQFTCYDAFDLDTPLTDVESIRVVKVQTTLINSAALGQNKTLTTSVYLRANSLGDGLEKGTHLEYDTLQGTTPSLAQIDRVHYICAYTGLSSDGWAVVLTVNTDTWDITRGTAFEFDGDNGETPVLAKIDETHYLCAYTGDKSDGWAVVLTVDTGTWNITKETPFEYDTVQGTTPALAKIDDSHCLCVYTDRFSDGQAVVLTINTGNWTITKETPFEFDTSNGGTPGLAKIDDTHYLCAYTGPGSDGWVVVLTLDMGNWTLSRGTAFEYDASFGLSPALAQIDSTHYLCAYTGPGTNGWVVVLTVDTGSWSISKETPLEFDTSNGETPALAKIDDTHYLCAYEGPGADGFAVVLAVESGTWAITKGTPYEYDTSTGLTPTLAQIDPNEYLCAYEGPGGDGWSVVLNYTSGGGQILP
ncbi:MAG: hypothetical protein FVQ85_11545 [Planctomycetes bacterium]|nr:hypothetical protein [Planctomycetota bacterium]